MAKKETPVNSNINNNNNNINIKLDAPKRTYTRKKKEPDWYKKTIIGGIIALALSLCGYYVKKSMDAKSSSDSIITGSQH